MEFQQIRDLGEESVLCRTRTGSQDDEIVLDKAKFAVMPRDSVRLEMQKEMRAIVQSEKEISHSSLVKYTALEKFQGELYLVREEPVKSGIRQLNPVEVDIAEACRIMLKALEVSEVYRQAGIFLEGLSLGMIKRDETGEIRIQDPLVVNHFAKFLEPFYRKDPAPEVVMGKPWNERSVIFCWGNLAYQLLTGVDPFAAKTPEERLAKITQIGAVEPKALNPRISPELNRLIMECLAKNPDTRPSAETIRIRLEQMLETGGWEVSQAEADEFARQAQNNRKHFERRERFMIWFRKYGVISCGIVAAILIFVLITVATKPKGVLTASTSPDKVIRYYFQSIKDLNVSLFDETVQNKKNSMESLVTNLYVMNRTQQGMTYNMSQEFVKVRIPRMKLVKISQGDQTARYRADFLLVISLSNQIQYQQRSEIYTLQPVHRIWRITAIRTISEKHWSKKIETPEVSPGPVPSASSAPQN